MKVQQTDKFSVISYTQFTQTNQTNLSYSYKSFVDLNISSGDLYWLAAVPPDDSIALYPFMPKRLKFYYINYTYTDYVKLRIEFLWAKLTC